MRFAAFFAVAFNPLATQAEEKKDPMKYGYMQSPKSDGQIRDEKEMEKRMADSKATHKIEKDKIEAARVAAENNKSALRLNSPGADKAAVAKFEALLERNLLERKPETDNPTLNQIARAKLEKENDKIKKESEARVEQVKKDSQNIRRQSNSSTSGNANNNNQRGNNDTVANYQENARRIERENKPNLSRKEKEYYRWLLGD